MNPLKRVRWKLALSCLVLIVVGVAGWQLNLLPRIMRAVFANLNLIGIIYAFGIGGVSLFHLIAKRDSLESSVASYHILGPVGDLLLSGITSWSAFFSSLSVLKFVILSPTTLEINNVSQQAVIGLPLAGTVFWSLRGTLKMVRETFLTPEGATPTAAPEGQGPPAPN